LGEPHAQPLIALASAASVGLVALAPINANAVKAPGGEAYPPLDRLRSQCTSCHNRKTRVVEQLGEELTVKGCDVHGCPLDPNHPWYQAIPIRMISLNIISLERSHERRAFMQRQLGDLDIPFRFFNAVDGSKMTVKKIKEAVGVKLTPGEIGCALSHLAVIREIAEGEHEYAAILEDDVFILPEARRFLDEQYLRSLPPFDILQLDGNHLEKRRLTLNVGNIGGYQMCALTKCHHIMFAQVYTCETARRIAASISDVTAPIDSMIFQDRRPFGLRVVEVRPSVVRHNDDFASAIGPRLRVEGFFAKLGRETRRFRNWARRWRSFVRAWGLWGILRLHLQGGQQRPRNAPATKPGGSPRTSP
jgi:GR25 family glycosyltransferase involved in LPS biosynthesis